jgi:predicted dehydrogenase
MTPPLRGLVLGAGYFSQFHLEAWARISEVAITAVCDHDARRAGAARERFGLPRCYADALEAIDTERPHFVDVVTPPETHLDLCRAAPERSVHVICQKPLAPSGDEARRLVDACSAARIRLMVHENFPFQPWHREIKRLLAAGAIGTALHSLSFRSRPGDGWGPDAYLGRQPYFRTMPRFLISLGGART